MGTSIASNLNSLNAQESFRVNSEFQAGVIQRLTSGYRISKISTTASAGCKSSMAASAIYPRFWTG